MQLADYLKAEGIAATEFAKRIDRSEATVSRIVRGVNRPDWSTMQKIRIATNDKVMPNDFFTDEAAA